MKTMTHCPKLFERSIGVAALGVLFVATAAAQPAQPMNQQLPPLMNRDDEVQLALSACPEPVAGKAGVYVLTATGYAKVRESQNGFTAIVQHSVPGAQEPQCMDEEGGRSILPRILMLAELRARGLSPAEIKRAMADALAKGMLHPPTRLGVDYMLSPRNIVPDDKGVIAPFPPHVMFYAPYMTNAQLGSGGQAAGGPAFVAGEGSPFALIIVPVRQHSDHAMANMQPPGSP
ncbi:MAG TPA: hypothetical protein VKB71_19150 [Rhizomicrobium sp.]|nr:hypothetical protein [Rhizomicrobium sp.]